MVVIPALDAGFTVGDVVRASLAQLPAVVVVNDGSTDATPEAAAAAGAVVLHHPHNLGKGAALRTGFRHALENGFDAVITVDADGQHLPSEIPKFVRAWRETGADLIIGDRSHLFGGMLPRRRNANMFSAWAISKCAGRRVTDSQSGFRLYSASLIREVSMDANGFAAESEIIVRAGRLGKRILSIPIELGFVNGISTSHYRPLLDTLRIAGVVARTRIFG
ncbi:MAG: glycosyltransferase family 2 protein [Acidobacteria bacterium]|nr:glycosyltransferase family 2 protein [Acidobacteriota bacterium]